ncbi:sodium:solute symporter family protein [Hoyosella subflava]|uniref:Solute:sodium symporter family transporter n=1 Tax=Hoyosella subflava (strain DSM 45089 / JCM 17490 / NBRC 109087 / DQS3-9A1) TaxID=443218 RepID=F6EIH0_HOYSD|nr:sodium:solute symporter family protein [Hoyosella subflava]AEF42462.1 Solute:sodium symporter family transporter [Hoyosella subflava DQS3-9A1]
MTDIQLWTLIFVGGSFAVYIYVAYRSRVKDTSEFYVAGGGIPAPANGAAIAADWMSAASFISMAGLIALANNGYGGAAFLMGWTGGYVLLALLLAPYLRKFGKYTIPDFVGDRYNETARLIAVGCALVVSLTYVVGQMAGAGVVFGRFLGVDTTIGVLIGMTVVFFYAVLGGMKGITWTQVCQYAVLITAYLIPAVAVSAQLTGIPVPQVGFGQILDELEALQAELGFSEYTAALFGADQMNMILLTASLMFGTAGLPHVIIRFYTASSVRAARYSALWALFFIALLYTTAPTVAAFAKFNILENSIAGTLSEQPWFSTWSDLGLITNIAEEPIPAGSDAIFRGDGANEVLINNDILVLASPEIAGLPAPIVGLVAAGGVAAALSTASGLLLVISSAVANDLYHKRINPKANEKQQLLVARISMAVGILVAGYLGINPPGFAGEVVALAFGLAAASFFPTLLLGIFWKKCTAIGAAAGMGTGITVTMLYFIWTLPTESAPIFLGNDPIADIAPTGFGVIGMLLNFAVTWAVSMFTPKPTLVMQNLVEEIRYPGHTELVAKHAANEDVHGDEALLEERTGEDK